jgi:hypothetical protein
VVFLGKGTDPALKKGAIDIGLKLFGTQGFPNYLTISVAQQEIASDILDLGFA